jgi:uncharacterized membrane protein
MATKTKPIAKSSPESSAEVLTQHWSGPLPPPGALAQFNTIIPDGANRIMAMIEQEQHNRIAHNKTALDSEISDTRRGHLIGGAISVCAIAGAVFTAYIGAHPAVSIALVGLPIVSIVQSFLNRK